MANVLSDDRRHQVEALGRLGWTLRRIQRETGVRRETASEYLRAAGIPVRGRGGSPPKPATSEPVITDPDASKPATSAEVMDPQATEDMHQRRRRILDLFRKIHRPFDGYLRDER